MFILSFSTAECVESFKPNMVHMIFHFIGGKGQINKETDRNIDNAGFSEPSIDHFTVETSIFVIQPFIA